jgi:hypothetical protein
MLCCMVGELSAAIGTESRRRGNCSPAVAASVFEELAAVTAERLAHRYLTAAFRTWKRLLQLSLRFYLYTCYPAIQAVCK